MFASIVAPFGGFFASAIKRAYHKKDFDSLFPGHGGLMDRMDCQLIMLTFTYVHYNTFIRIRTGQCHSLWLPMTHSYTTPYDFLWLPMTLLYVLGLVSSQYHSLWLPMTPYDPLLYHWPVQTGQYHFTTVSTTPSPAYITHEHIYSLTHILSLTHSNTQTPTHSLTHPLTHPPTHSPTHSLTDSLAHSLTHSLTHSLNLLYTALYTVT